jgi:hypothetical protein
MDHGDAARHVRTLNIARPNGKKNGSLGTVARARPFQAHGQRFDVSNHTPYGGREVTAVSDNVSL